MKIEQIVADEFPDNCSSPCVMKVFSGPQQAGEICHLYACPPLPQPHTNETVCFTWPIDAAVQVQCVKHRQAIEFCGHGLFAAAHWWLGRGYQGPLLMNDRLVEVVHREGRVYLSFDRQPLDAVTVPDWLPWAGEGPVNAAVSPEKNGYLIVEWPPDTDLTALPISFRAIRENTQRAVIYTRRHGDAICMRYFAPQYDTPEGTATGSAAKLMGDYWSDLLPAFDLVQQSAGGGNMQVMTEAGKVLVGGNCQLISG